MSKPRPFHHPPRELRTAPDESEPAFSYEDESEDFEFHQRYARGPRRDSGGNSGSGHFWRTTSGTGEPPFSSVKIQSPDKVEKGSSALAAVMQSDGVSVESAGSGSPSAPATISSNQTKQSVTIPNPPSVARREQSNTPSTASRDNQKKKDKQLSADRRRKLDAQSSEIDAGHIIDEMPNFAEMQPQGTSLDRSSSDQSTGSLLYGKTPGSGNLLGKTSSLIFPTGVDAGSAAEPDTVKRRKINLLLDQCEATRFPFKKKLILSNLGISVVDIPLNYLCGTSLGNSLYKLALAGNRLGSVPPRLVTSLPNLKSLDLSQCELHQLPDQWSLPQLKTLNLSHNRLRDFPEQGILEGLPELQELNMYGNKVAEIIIPPNCLSKLEVLNLGYNDLAFLPDELDLLRALKTLKLMNNFLEKVPMRVCEMDLKTIDVSSNPVIQPPIETCERGICSMKRYYHCLKVEEQSKRKSLDEVQRKSSSRLKRKDSKKKSYGGFMKSLSKNNKLQTPSASFDLGPSGPLSPLPSQPSSKSVTEPPNYAAVTLSARSARSESDAGAMTIDSSEDSNLLTRPRIHSIDDAETRPRIHSIDDAETGISMDDGTTKSGIDAITVNDTLKVIFVGMAMVGKTSMIRRLIEGENAVVPTLDDRTVGVDIYEWDPKKDKRFERIDSRIVFQDDELAEQCGDVNVKLSVWDFAGQHVYHATHELFFSPRALYVLVWDMGANNRKTLKRKSSLVGESGAFKLSYDSSDDEDDNELASEEEARRADRALEHDIDEKVQFWIDCIQSSAPGAAIIPVASFDDFFRSEGGEAEAKRRCKMLKQRLLLHEERRIKGIKERLKGLQDENRAGDPAANRLRKLLCSYTRPKILFRDDEDDCVVRVSGTQYTGFENLTGKILDIATGRDKGAWSYPIFHGHVGARIPRMRLDVRDTVRKMRREFKVVEWGYFLNELRDDHGLTSVEDISDSLHFLTNTGELSFFGGVMNQQVDNPLREKPDLSDDERDDKSMDGDADDADDDHGAVLSLDDTSITAPSTDEDGSLTSVDGFMSSGLSQFVFLNPRWLVAAVACILRHDLDREIKETKRMLSSGRPHLTRNPSFYDGQLNCPVITADDACMLWQAKKVTKIAARKAQDFSNNMTVTPFEFLQLLLIRFGVFVPIDLSIEKAFLGGKEYAQLVDGLPEGLTEIAVDANGQDTALKAKFFFLPSLLGSSEPSEAWTYKSTDSWKTTLCHSVLFPDGVPPGLMERLTASVLSSIYAVAHRDEALKAKDAQGRDIATYEGSLSVREVLCWRTAFFIKLATLVEDDDGTKRESTVEIFCLLADRESHLCVGSDRMSTGMRTLIVSSRGQAGDGARKIWKGGYLLVIKCIQRVIDTYGGLEYEKLGFCPECLAKRPVSEASGWEFSSIRTAVSKAQAKLRCHHGHEVDTRLVAGPMDALQRPQRETIAPADAADSSVPVKDLLPAIVLVGLWDSDLRKVIRVGSGFIVDKKRGLIVTASHTLMNIRGDGGTRFGENYFGLRNPKVAIGVIPSGEGDSRDMAVFRYFAAIVAKDPEMESGECHVDACILRITTKMDQDVGGDGQGCGDQAETLLMNNPSALRDERLQSLKISEKCELEEQVRIIGFNQGGEGLLGPGESLNRYVDFARGYVCKKFTSDEESAAFKLRDRFNPRSEIAVICPTIGGHSGGPCVNQQGEVIGILSRADRAENHRCYISPTSEWKPLIKKAKKSM